MKLFYAFLLLMSTILIGFSSCSNTSDQKISENDTVEVISKAHEQVNSTDSLPASYLQIKEVENDPNIEEKWWTGYYTGSFGKNKLTIRLEGEDGDSIFGFSICAGNYSYLKGILKDNKIWMYENEDIDHSGIFDLEINDNILEGSWTPYDNKKDLTKEFVLQKKSYKYDIKAGKYAFASQRKLQREDVENLNTDELRIMVNEIYARYGYCFYKKDMRYYFESQPWYMPITTYVGENVTELEWDNIDLITKYTKYYDETADDFGR